MLELEESIVEWARRELKKKKKRRRKMLLHLILCDGRNNGLLWTIFEDLGRDEAKYF
jgi:hypothetical protein